MSHLAQVGNSPRAVLPLIKHLGWASGWGSPDRDKEMALLRSGGRGAARTPLLPAGASSPGAAGALGRSWFVLLGVESSRFRCLICPLCRVVFSW